MLRLCKEKEIPIPPSGYWTKLSFGKPVIQTPLPKSPFNEVILLTNITPKRSNRSANSESTIEVNAENNQSKTINNPVKTIVQTEDAEEEPEIKESDEIQGRKLDYRSVAPQQALSFLTESERQKVLLVSQQIQMPAENMHMNKEIIAYKSVIKEWNKKDIKTKGAQRSFNNFSNRPPFLAGVISSETLSRVFRILDALFRQIEYMGGSVNDDLSFNIRNENVHIVVIEYQDEIKHEMTREEAKELLIYEDAKRHHSWASEPKIRKYDYVFNGRLRITIRKSKYFRDTDSINIESRLGEMFLELYEESEVVRINREAQEEARLKREEEKRLREERRNRYNDEIDRTIALSNIAQDYDVACKIRSYISAVESSENMDDKTASWIEWAKKKADWFDPTVARIDELFEKRKHEKNEDQKTLRKAYY